MNTLNKAIKIIEILQQNKYQAVFAGGFVRDKLLNKPYNDIDIATDATPDQIISLFGKASLVGKQFGVVLVTFQNETFDVATFRKDGIYSDGRRPDTVEFTTFIEEDAKRRDLTINGLYWDPIKDEIIDYIGGQEDLRKKRLRFIGKTYDRITEDKIRILRTIRFAVKLNDFKLDKETFKAIKQNAYLLENEPTERIHMEFFGKPGEKKGIFHLGNPRKALNLLLDTKMLKYTIPELILLKGCKQPKQYHPEGCCWEHTILALEFLKTNASTELIVATLLHDIGKPSTQTFEDRIRFNQHEKVGKEITAEIVKRLKFSNESQKQIIELVENHMKFPSVDKMKKSKLKRFMSLNKFFEEHMELHRVDCLSSHGDLNNYNFLLNKKEEFENSNEEITIKPENRLITGVDLLNMGLKSGPIFKEILTFVETEQLEGNIIDKKSALDLVNNFLRKKKER